jgi:N-acetylmuramoyl-L-alanine amidase
VSKRRLTAKAGFVVLSLAAGILPRGAGAVVQLGHGITLAVPEADSVFTELPAHRVGGMVAPGSELRINGEPVTVYPNGAFARLLPLQAGRNEFRFESVTPAGEKTSHVLLFFHPGPPQPVPRDTLLIAEEGLEPSSDLWLRAGDILELRCKATPGCRVSAGGKALQEEPCGTAGGLEGIYRATFRISGSEGFRGDALEFCLTDSAGRSVRRFSRGRVRILKSDAPLVGVTQGERPALNNGPGKDRLGGARLGFLEPDIPLTITGKAKGQYRVDLADEGEAWIEEQEIRLLPAGTVPTESYTGSVIASGDSTGDVVTLALDRRLPWSSSQGKDPARIFIDVYGAVLNTNWINHTGTAREVTGVAIWQAAPRVIRIEIELAHRQIWGYTVAYGGTTLTIRVRRPPVRSDLEGLTVAVDAGHGGSNEGAIGSTGMKEKIINLAVSHHLRDVLTQRGASVIMTRIDDSFSHTSERLTRVLASNADILVSIHGNSIGMSGDPEAIRGVSTYYRHPCYRALAGTVLEELADAGLPSFGCVGNFNFLLNAPTDLPTVLVEQAFLSHPADEILLLDDGFRREIAEKIADGIERFVEAGAD